MDAARDLEQSSDDDQIEVPSCIDSLVNSANQLHQLAYYAENYYIKTVLNYGLAVEPARILQPDGPENVVAGSRNKPKGAKLANIIRDGQALDRLQTLVDFLPFLNELNSFIERCVSTIEFTLKRSTYHLNKVTTGVRSEGDNRANVSFKAHREFNLTCDARIDAVFVAIMDLVYAMVSLDQTIKSHTRIAENLTLLRSVCQLVSQPSVDDAADVFSQVPQERLTDLMDYIDNIHLTLCNEQKPIFQQCLDAFEHLDLILSKDKTKLGYNFLNSQFVKFLMFYGENMIDSTGRIDHMPTSIQRSAPELSLYSTNQKIIPTLYMTSTPRKLFGLIALNIFYNCIYKKPDKRVAKIIIQALQKFKATNILHLIGSNCSLKFDEFIAAYMPQLGNKVRDRLKLRDEQQLKLDLSSELDRQTMRVVPWLMRLETEMLAILASIDSKNTEHLAKRVAFLEHGIHLGEEINDIVRSTITIYLERSKPISLNNLIPLLRHVALLKSIETSVEQYRVPIIEWLTGIEVAVRLRWSRTLSNAQKRLVAQKYSQRKLDLVTAMTLISLCNRADMFETAIGRRVMPMCLTMLAPSLTSDELSDLNSLMSVLSLDFFSQLRTSLHCGHLYWSQPTFGAYYGNAFESAPSALNEVPYFLRAFDNIRDVFELPIEAPSWRAADVQWIQEKGKLFLNKLGDDLVDQFKSELLDKICQELEMELRLQTHRDLNLERHNSFRRHLYNFKSIFPISKSSVIFRILDRTISLDYYVERYLNRVCYILTTVVPNDWHTYDSMISLARQKYNLKFVNTQLPTQTHDSGLDLLDITRNLPLFASRYGYDLTNQVFVEKSANRLSSAASIFSGGGNGPIGLAASISSNYAPSSSNQSINVIQVKHIARSLQTHGFGLLNSSVNCTYQTMKRLINIFAKQLSDDKLKTTLSKESQQLNLASIKQTANQMPTRATTMTFDKATRMVKKFRFSVGSEQTDEQSHRKQPVDLDSMRQTITQLGNLLAFIRSLKSGALYCASKTADYLPDLDDLATLRLSKYADSEFSSGYESAASDSLRNAAENFDQCLSDLDENFLPKTNYFNVIINLFTNILSSSSSGSSKRASEANRSGDLSNGTSPNDTNHAEISSSSVTSEETPTTQPPTNPTTYPSTNSKRDHLKLFFLLVPALTINYIDYIINCKDRVSSRSSAARYGALISDDGFSMGVAFLLTVLEQTQEFARLEWFKREVKMKLEEDRKEIESRMGDQKCEESLRLTASVTLRRLDRLIMEYAGLDYSLSSALLFFRSSKLSPS